MILIRFIRTFISEKRWCLNKKPEVVLFIWTLNEAALFFPSFLIVLPVNLLSPQTCTMSRPAAHCPSSYIYIPYKKQSFHFSQIFVPAYSCLLSRFSCCHLCLSWQFVKLQKQHGATPIRHLSVYSANARVHTILCGWVVGLSHPSGLRRATEERDN